MGIFDLFNFKKEFAKVFSKENFVLLTALAKEQIIAQVKKNIPGSEKMDVVVDAVLDYINKHMTTNNGLVLWIRDNILIPNVRVILQALYDALKQKVKDL